MDCPRCGFEWLRAARERRENGEVLRQYRCYGCGHRFETVELVREVAQRRAFEATLYEILTGRTHLRPVQAGGE